MYFIIENNKQIASEDIRCYKKVKRTFRDDLCLSGRKRHCYMRGVKQPIVTFAGRRIGDVPVITFGYSSWTENVPWQIPNAVFVIPKGSMYYYNSKYREYVSDSISFLGFLD
jgi:hypothetical protein